MAWWGRVRAEFEVLAPGVPCIPRSGVEDGPAPRGLVTCSPKSSTGRKAKKVPPQFSLILLPHPVDLLGPAFMSCPLIGGDTMVGCHGVTPNPTNTSGSVNKVWMRKVRSHDHVTTRQGLQLGDTGEALHGSGASQDAGNSLCRVSEGRLTRGSHTRHRQGWIRRGQLLYPMALSSVAPAGDGQVAVTGPGRRVGMGKGRHAFGRPAVTWKTLGRPPLAESNQRQSQETRNQQPSQAPRRPAHPSLGSGASGGKAVGHRSEAMMSPTHPPSQSSSHSTKVAIMGQGVGRCLAVEHTNGGCSLTSGEVSGRWYTRAGP